MEEGETQIKEEPSSTKGMTDEEQLEEDLEQKMMDVEVEKKEEEPVGEDLQTKDTSSSCPDGEEASHTTGSDHFESVESVKDSQSTVAEEPDIQINEASDPGNMTESNLEVESVQVGDKCKTPSDNVEFPINTESSYKYSEDSTHDLMIPEQQTSYERRKTMSESSDASSEKQHNMHNSKTRERTHRNSPEEPDDRQRIYNARPGFTFEPGVKLEAMDYLNNWYLAKIVRVDWDAHEVQIHFEGWNARYDEWVDFQSERLRPVARQSNRRDGLHEDQKYKPGEQVLARWTDCRFYPAQILACNNNGSFEVLFYDGIKKNVQAINIRDMPHTLQEKKHKESPTMREHEREWSRPNSRRKMERSQSLEDVGPVPHKRRFSGNSGPVTSKRICYESNSPRSKEIAHVEVGGFWDGPSSDEDGENNFCSDDDDFIIPTNLDLEDPDEYKDVDNCGDWSFETNNPRSVQEDTQRHRQVAEPRTMPIRAPSYGNGIQLTDMPCRLNPVPEFRWHHYGGRDVDSRFSRGSPISDVEQSHKLFTDVTGSRTQLHATASMRHRNRRLTNNADVVITKDRRPTKILVNTPKTDSFKVQKFNPQFDRVSVTHTKMKRNFVSAHDRKNQKTTTSSMNHYRPTSDRIRTPFTHFSASQRAHKKYINLKGNYNDLLNTGSTVNNLLFKAQTLGVPPKSHASCCKCLQNYVDVKFDMIVNQLTELRRDMLEIKQGMQSVRKDAVEETRKGLEDLKDDIVTNTVTCVMEGLRETIQKELRAVISDSTEAEDKGSALKYMPNIGQMLNQPGWKLPPVVQNKSSPCYPISIGYSPSGSHVDASCDHQKTSPELIQKPVENQPMQDVNSLRSQLILTQPLPRGGDAFHCKNSHMISQANNTQKSATSKESVYQNSSADIIIKLEVSDDEDNVLIEELPQEFNKHQALSNHVEQIGRTIGQGFEYSTKDSSNTNKQSRNAMKNVRQPYVSNRTETPQLNTNQMLFQNRHRNKDKLPSNIPNISHHGTVYTHSVNKNAQRNQAGSLPSVGGVYGLKTPALNPNSIGSVHVPEQIHKTVPTLSPTRDIYKECSAQLLCEMVTIGAHPYSIQIPKRVYSTILSKSKSVTFFVRKLLSNLFTSDELASSRIDAGEVVWKSKRTFKNALDPFRLQVILLQARKDFPGFNGDLKDSLLREVINCKCRCAAFHNLTKE